MMRVWKVVEDGDVRHYVTAESEDAAIRIIVNQFTLSDLDLEGVEFKAEALPDDKDLTVNGDGDPAETHTCAEWARMAPREYLACSEW